MNSVPFTIKVKVKGPTLFVYAANKNNAIKPHPIIQTVIILIIYNIELLATLWRKGQRTAKARSREITRRMSNETLEKITEKLAQMFTVTIILPCEMVVNAVFISSVRPTSRSVTARLNRWIGSFEKTHPTPENENGERVCDNDNCRFDCDDNTI